LLAVVGREFEALLALIAEDFKQGDGGIGQRLIRKILKGGFDGLLLIGLDQYCPKDSEEIWHNSLIMAN
jgi:hypothetical protein